ncbi:MAG: carbamoyltransferase HypF [Bradymonadales bacterium]|nr:carbamoyltransferase HypF [Bradymonadales bacterium]
MAEQGRRIEIRGVVQGVGFRPWVARLASDSGLTGRIGNCESGVLIQVFGTVEALDRFLEVLGTSPPPVVSIDRIHWEEIPLEPCERFTIELGGESDERRVHIPPDLGICQDCREEIADPADRRYRYPFTTCALCGPRFTIARDIPYDRPRTTMAAFAMCPQCKGELESVEGRRFGAHTNACSVCGPRLTLLRADGQPLDAVDPLLSAAAALKEGLTIAVKGLGGFHLACDATSSHAVARLRGRMNRDQKPFAVMVRDLEEADRVAHLGPTEQQQLTGPPHPTLLLRRRDPSPLVREVTLGSPLLGLMLPATAMDHLLLAEVGRSLVMAAGRLGEEPIAYLNMEAVERLSNLADYFLVHNREIETPCEDSVVRVFGEQPVLLRRSLGYVPRPITVSQPFTQPVLACGAHLKNTFCLGMDDVAYLGPHIGDLENLEAYELYQAAIQRMERFVRIRPQVIAHDLHRDYLSTTYARNRFAPITVAVQHQHAHVASVIGEHRIEGPVIGVAFEGTGVGTDGTTWGGELLVANLEKYKRVATFRPIPLAGGDTAVRQVWRIALALLDDAFDGNPPLSRLELFDLVDQQDVDVVRSMMRQRLNTTLARGVGRYLDGYGSLVLSYLESSFDRQVALAWEFAANLEESGQYPYAIDFEETPWVVDLRPTTRELVVDLLEGCSRAVIATRFHNTLIAITVELIRTTRARFGKAPVVLTGDCFQNAVLTEGLLQRLVPELTLYLPRQVPFDDGALALGQALVAEAQLRRKG